MRRQSLVGNRRGNRVLELAASLLHDDGLPELEGAGAVTPQARHPHVAGRAEQAAQPVPAPAPHPAQVAFEGRGGAGPGSRSAGIRPAAVGTRPGIERRDGVDVLPAHVCTGLPSIKPSQRARTNARSRGRWCRTRGCRRRRRRPSSPHPRADARGDTHPRSRLKRS